MISINTDQYRWHEFPDLLALQEAALGAILDSAALAIQERERFNLVLSGGETPRGVYNRLRSVPTDWSAWHM